MEDKRKEEKEKDQSGIFNITINTEYGNKTVTVVRDKNGNVVHSSESPKFLGIF